MDIFRSVHVASCLVPVALYYVTLYVLQLFLYILPKRNSVFLIVSGDIYNVCKNVLTFSIGQGNTGSSILI